MTPSNEQIETESCPKCQRLVHKGNPPATGFLADCGRRIVNRAECRINGCSKAALSRPDDVESVASDPMRFITVWRKTGEQCLDWDFHVSENVSELREVENNLTKQDVKQRTTYYLGPQITAIADIKPLYAHPTDAYEKAALAMEKRRKEWDDCIEAGCKRVSVSIRTAEAIRDELEWAEHTLRALAEGEG